MKSTKLMTIALCAMACTAATAFAEDDLIASATPSATIADPVNPKPGMIFKGYDLRKVNISELDKCATVKTTVVADDKFSLEKFRNVRVSQGVWEGFLKGKRSVNCTVVAQQPTYNGCWYTLFINGKEIVGGSGQKSRKFDLKAGFNHVKLVAQGHPVHITIKATDSLKDPRPMTPKDLFYDEKPEEDDVF